MFKRLEIKKFFAFLLVACLLAGGIALLPATAYAEPTEDPAVTEEVVDEPTVEEAAQEPAQSQEASGIVVDAADEEEEANPMDTILGFDTIIKEIWSKWCSRLLIVLGILVTCVIGILIYIMITQTTKVSKQNKQLERRPDRQLASNQPAPAQQEESVRQVKQFGDTLRIRRTVSQQGNAPVRQANMQRPVAPQRPSRPAQQGQPQPGVRRPVQGQPVRRPMPGQQPQRPNGAGIHQPQRPMQAGARPAQPGARPVQRPTQPAARPAQPKQPTDQNK